MIGVLFDKAKAKHFLDCLANGKDIPQWSENGWTGHDMLALAGACFFAAMSQGPALYRYTDWSKVPSERLEAINQDHFADLHAAIEFYGHLSGLVFDGHYDGHFERECQAIVDAKDGKKTVIPVKGHKQDPREVGT